MSSWDKQILRRICRRISMQTSHTEVVIKLYASTTVLTPRKIHPRILIPLTDTSSPFFLQDVQRAPPSHRRALKKRGHVRDLRRRVPHIKSLRRSVTDERAPSPVHFVIHISQHARATRRIERTAGTEGEGERGMGDSRRRMKRGEKERTRPE